MPAETEAQKASFAAFLAKVPEAPSSASPTHPDAEDPEPAADAEAPKGSEPPAPPKTPRVRRSSPGSAPTTDQSPAAVAKTPSDLESVKAALRTGDLDALADLLEEDPALYDEKTPRWAAQKRREAKIAAERDATTAKAQRVVERWAPVADDTEAIRGGAYERLFGLVQALTGEDPETAWAKALRARGVQDPRVPVLSQRAAAAEARTAELESERTKRADAAFYETLRDEVDAGDVVRQIDGWEEQVATVLRESVDPDLGEPRLSVKQAAARVVRREREEYERRAKVFGNADSAPARKPRAKSPERASGASGVAARKLTREEWLAARSNG